MSHRSEVSASAISQERPDSEVLAKPERRRFTAEYKLRILQEAEQCANGERGALLRRRPCPWLRWVPSTPGKVFHLPSQRPCWAYNTKGPSDRRPLSLPGAATSW